MAAMRCKLPEFGKDDAAAARCRPTIPSSRRRKDPMSPDKRKLYDTDARPYDPKTMALFQRHPVLLGVSNELYAARSARASSARRVKRVPEGEEIRHLNIMPMMDMMTILLVAFIFQVGDERDRADRRRRRAAARPSTDEPLPENASTLDHHARPASSSRGKSIVSRQQRRGRLPSEKEGGASASRSRA